MSGIDLENNLPSALQGLGYRTGVVGKWHLSNSGPMSMDNYTVVMDMIREAGFDFADGVYAENIPREPVAFSHNMEVLRSLLHAHLSR